MLQSRILRSILIWISPLLPLNDSLQDIEDVKYCVIVTNIEMLNAVRGHFDRLWKKEHFTDHVISVVWDEGHCVSVWSGFWEYKNVEQLWYIIPKHIPFYVTSATMPDIVLQDIMNRMKISKDAYFFQQSNDHLNVNHTCIELIGLEQRMKQ